MRIIFVLVWCSSSRVTTAFFERKPTVPRTESKRKSETRRTFTNHDDPLFFLFFDDEISRGNGLPGKRCSFSSMSDAFTARAPAILSLSLSRCACVCVIKLLILSLSLSRLVLCVCIAREL